MMKMKMKMKMKMMTMMMMMIMIMMIMIMMMWMCKRPAQVPMLCVPIYNMKLAMMQKKTHSFTTFSAHTKMAADKRGQIEVFARNSNMHGFTCS